MQAGLAYNSAPSRVSPLAVVNPALACRRGATIMPGTNIGSHRSIKMPDDLLARWGVPATAPPIVQEALVYWESKCAGRRMPARRDLDPMFEIPSLLPWVMLVDVLRQPLDFRYRLIGTGIAARARHDHTGCRFSDLSRAGSDSVVWKDRMAVVQTRAPKLTTPALHRPRQPDPRCLWHPPPAVQ